jgi:hypothetical protein
MLRALAWKEWREQRPLVYAGVILVAAMPLFLAAGLPLTGPSWGVIDLLGVLPVVLGAVVWPVLAVAAGASTISNEAVGHTLGFLLSRPVSRSRLWLIKVSVALGSVVLVAAISLVLVQICTWWLSQGRMDLSVGVLLRRTTLGPFDFLVLMSASLLLFACATVLSSLISRPLPAAAAGVVLALLVLTGIMLLWAAFSLSPRREPEWLAASVALAAAMLLAISFAVFARAEVFRRGAGWSRSALPAALVIGLAMLVAIPVALAGGRVDPGELVIRGDQISVSGTGVAVAVPGRSELGGEIWLVRADGSGTMPMTGGLATAPAFARRAREVLYFSQRGLWGSPMGSYDLRAARVDGKSDRLVAAGLPAAGELYSSAWGRRALFASATTLYLIELNGREVTTFDIGVPELEGATLAGWIESLADEVLFLRREPTGRGDTEELTLLAFGLRDAATRTIYSSRITPSGYVQPSHPRYGWVYFPVPLPAGDDTAGTLRIDLVDLESGEVVTLGEGTCFSGRFDRNELLTYVLCTEEEGRSVATVKATYVDRDEEHLISEIDLAGGSVTLIDTSLVGSRPFRTWVLLRKEMSPDGESAALVLGPDGHRLSMLPGWIPVGLSGASRVLLVDDLERIRTIASGDVRTGMLQVIFP